MNSLIAFLRLSRLSRLFLNGLQRITVLSLSAAFFLFAAGPAQAVLFEKDCPEVTYFKKAIPKLTKAQCTTMGAPDGDFFAGSLPNGDKKGAGWKDLPVCLGYGSDITPYLAAHPNACRRLSARENCPGKDTCWTEELNQQLLQCTADGLMSPKPPIWTTSTANIGKQEWTDKNPQWEKRAWSDAWKKLVTASEMCYIYGVNKTWVVGVSK